MLDNKKEILQAQKLQQSKGLGSDGKPFINKNTGKPTYSKSYARKKGKESPIDLEDKGDFKRDEFLDLRGATFVIDSADEKTEKLLAQFGENIFGLNSETKAELKPINQKTMKENVQKQLKRN